MDSGHNINEEGEREREKSVSKQIHTAKQHMQKENKKERREKNERKEKQEKKMQREKAKNVEIVHKSFGECVFVQAPARKAIEESERK